MTLNQSTGILSSRAIQGMFWEEISRLAADQASVVNQIGFMAQSDQASEQYAWLGHVPKLAEWIGARNLQKLRASDYSIKNKHFEAGITIPVPDMRRDKTPQLRARIGELAEAAEMHKHELITALMIAGAATACYDGQYFYDTDHSEGASGTQSNDLALTAVAAATPTQVEMATLITKMLEALYGFKDDQGRAMNRSARQFLLMVPVAYWGTALAAVNNNIIGGASNSATSNPLQNLPATITVVAEPDLGTSTTMYLHRTDAKLKPFIVQEETGTLQLKSKAEGSEYEFDHDAHAHGVDVWRNAGYGLWQYSVLCTLSDA